MQTKSWALGGIEEGCVANAPRAGAGGTDCQYWAHLNPYHFVLQGPRQVPYFKCNPYKKAMVGPWVSILGGYRYRPWVWVWCVISSPR